MTYTLPAWSNDPSTATPLDAANLLEINDAIDDLDSRATDLDTRTTAVETALPDKVDGTLAVNVGDMLVAAGTDTFAGFTVGADGDILTADSTQTLGMKWAPTAAAGVASVTALNSTITVDNTDPVNPTVGVNVIAESKVTNLVSDLAAKAADSAVVHNTGAETVAGVKTFSSAPVVPSPGASGNPVRNDDSRLSDSRAPSGTAGGSLAGSYPNPTFAAGSVGGTEVAAGIKDPVAATAGLRTLGTSSVQACAGNDSRLSDARTPTSHHTTHSTGGGDAIAPADIGAEASANKGAASGYASLDGSTKVPIAQLPTGSSSSTVAIGNDSRLSDARTPTSHHTTHSTGGTDAIAPADIGAEASANKAAASGYASLDGSTKVPIAQIPTGSSSSTVAIGNDSRLSDARTPTSHHTTHSTGGTDAIAPGDIGAVATSRQVLAGSGLSGGGALTGDVTLTSARVTSPANTVTYSSSITIDPTLGNNQNITATGALTLAVSTTGAIDGQMVMVSVLASGGARVVTLSGINIPSGLSSTLSVTSAKVGLFGFRYVGLLGTPAWVLMSEMQTT